MSNTQIQENQLSLYGHAYMPLLEETQAIHESFIGVSNKNSMLTTQPTAIDRLLRSVTLGIVGALLIGGIGIPLSIFIFPIPVLLTICIGLTASLLLNSIAQTIQIAHTKYQLRKLSAAYDRSLKETFKSEQELSQLVEEQDKLKNCGPSELNQTEVSPGTVKEGVEESKDENLKHVELDGEQKELKIEECQQQIEVVKEKMQKCENERITIIGKKFFLLYGEPAELFAATQLIKKQNSEITRLMSENEKLENNPTQSDELMELNNNLTLKYKELETEINNFEEEISSLGSELKDKQEKCEEKEKELINQTKLNSKQADEIRELKSKIENLESKSKVDQTTNTDLCFVGINLHNELGPDTIGMTSKLIKPYSPVSSKFETHSYSNDIFNDISITYELKKTSKPLAKKQQKKSKRG